MIGSVILVGVGVVLLAFFVEIALRGSYNYVFICSISGAAVTFVAVLGLALVRNESLDLTLAYIAGSVTHFATFLMLQWLSATMLASQGEDIGQLWDTETKLSGLVFGSVVWPLMLLFLFVGLHFFLKKRGRTIAPGG